jgi:hypothetical protein
MKKVSSKAPKIVNINPAVQDLQEVITELQRLLDDGKLEHLVAVVCIRPEELAILSDEITMYDYHAIIGYMQTDAALRQLSSEILDGPEEE